jgi:soluble lytic murein transglycosylase-like protein
VRRPGAHAAAIAPGARDSTAEAPPPPRPPLAARDSLVADSAAFADSVRQVTRWLVANGAPEHRARPVARAVMTYARQRRIDPLLIVGVIGVENAELVTGARSRVGARGVMQVMPFWRKDIPQCGTDMHDVRVNVCLGTAVLRIALDASTRCARRCCATTGACAPPAARATPRRCSGAPGTPCS